MVKTKRWDEPREEGDGYRLLITRYMPRGVRKQDQTWDEWQPDLGPSKELHAAVYGKGGRMPISWEVYRARYLSEMRAHKEAIVALARRSAAGEIITLLCSSGCIRESRCHRILLKELIDGEAQRMAGVLVPGKPA